jgi:hypothetical protein
MRILLNPDGYVDLEAPIYMEEDYQKKFIDFFQKMFPGEVQIEKVEETERVFGDRQPSKDHRWTPEDFSLLLSDLDNSEIAKKLKISDMTMGPAGMRLLALYVQRKDL